MKIDQKRGDSRDSSSEEQFLLNLLADVASRLKKEHGFSDEQIIDKLSNSEQFAIPLEIFSFDLAPAEAIVKFLKETYDLSYHDISIQTARNERSIWASYKRAVSKMPEKFVISNPTLIPISVFQNSNFSILECLLTYLKDVKKMRGVEIAKLLNKHPANIWTIYNRAKKKNEE